MRVLFCALLMMIMWGGISPAHAQAPPFHPAKHVYVVPDGWEPPIGQAGVLELEGAAAQTRFPFYVVLMRELPHTGERNVEKAAGVVINNLARQWSAQGYNARESQLFLLAFNDRTYRFLAGSRWEQELGFKEAAHRPVLSLFEREVKTKRRDFKGGILALMGGVDKYLIEEPARRAKTQAEAARAEEMRRTAEARASLNAEVALLNTLLMAPELPSNIDLAEYRSMATMGQQVLDKGDPLAMQTAAETMAPRVAKIHAMVEKRQQEATIKKVGYMGLGFLGFLAMLGVGWMVNKRRLRIHAMQECFSSKRQHMQGLLDNALIRYAEFRDKDALRMLQKVVQDAPDDNQTKILLNRVTTTVDAIYESLMAMQSHLNTKLIPLARKGHFFNMVPLELAIDGLNTPFSFDTKEIEAEALFGSEHKQITVDPRTFFVEQSDQFKVAMEGWRQLEAAIASMNQPAEMALPMPTAEEFTKGPAASIGPAWYADHPILGCEGEQAYSSLNQMRTTDPVAYMGKLKEIQQKHAEILVRLGRLQESVPSLTAPAPLPLLHAVVTADQDPIVPFREAEQARARLRVMLIDGDRFEVEDVEGQVEVIDRLDEEATKRMARLQHAKTSVPSDITDIRAGAVASLEDHARQRLAAAAKVHSNVPSCESGAAAMKEVGPLLDRASAAYSKSSFLEAESLTAQARQSLQRAQEIFRAAIRSCDDLDERKAAFERRLTELPKVREQIAQRVSTTYGGRREVPVFRENAYCVHDHPVDYGFMVLEMDRERRAWEEAQDAARREYEAETARQRARDDHHRHSAHSHDHHYGSSSGGSYSSSGSDSSSGSSYSSSSSYDSSSGGSYSSGGGSDTSSGGSW